MSPIKSVMSMISKGSTPNQSAPRLMLYDGMTCDIKEFPIGETILRRVF